MTKKAGYGSESGSISQRHGSAGPDPDPLQNVMDPEHGYKPVSPGFGKAGSVLDKIWRGKGRNLLPNHSGELFGEGGGEHRPLHQSHKAVQRLPLVSHRVSTVYF
jgi:hypothetical protein